MIWELRLSPILRHRKSSTEEENSPEANRSKEEGSDHTKEETPKGQHPPKTVIIIRIQLPTRTKLLSATYACLRGLIKWKKRLPKTRTVGLFPPMSKKEEKKKGRDRHRCRLLLYDRFPLRVTARRGSRPICGFAALRKQPLISS